MLTSRLTSMFKHLSAGTLLSTDTVMPLYETPLKLIGPAFTVTIMYTNRTDKTIHLYKRLAILNQLNILVVSVFIFYF